MFFIFVKYSCTNIFHRCSLYTFYRSVLILSNQFILLQNKECMVWNTKTRNGLSAIPINECKFWCVIMNSHVSLMLLLVRLVDLWTISNAFYWVEFPIPRSLIDNKTTLVQVMADAEQKTSHYLNQCWPSSLTHICGTRGIWVKAIRKITIDKKMCLRISLMICELIDILRTCYDHF